MKKYNVKLIKHTILAQRCVEAESLELAKTQALPTFDKVDIDEYDDILISEDEVEE